MNIAKPFVFAIAIFGALALAVAARAEAALEPELSAPFGSFNGIDFVSHTGRFSGETSKGAFDVPFQIVVPSDPALGNGTLLFEPPHWFFGPFGRDVILGRDFLFDAGYSYAAVGWSEDGLSVLDPAATPIIIAGEEVENPGVLKGGIDVVGDVEILVQFVNVMKADPQAIAIAGNFRAFYSFGASQTSAAQLQILLGPEGQGLFDFSLLALRFWPEPFPGNFDRLAGEFEPPSGVGLTIFVNTESELIVSDAEQFRAATGNPDYRVYEIAGAPHFPLPPPLNPLDYFTIIRAAFAAGDAWERWGVEAPQSTLIGEGSGIDPIYGFETGIARDLDGNAVGGVRLPDVELGRALFIATNFEPIPDLEDFDPRLFGLWEDLKCEPLPDGSIRFRNHGQYVNRFFRHADALVSQGYLLASDAERMKVEAARSAVGKPGSCD
jgi:hypothetical protein